MSVSRLSWLLLSGVSVVHCTDVPALDDNLIEHVNSNDVGWTAGRNDKFKHMTLVEAQGLLGTLSSPSKPAAAAANTSGDDYSSSRVPVNFDTRTQWPNCIHAVRDQGHCGGCWAFAATEVLSDRFCIASKAASNVVLSPEDLMSCDVTKYTLGCDGGVPEYAWKFLETTGITTEACTPFIGNKTEACPTSCNGTTTFHKYKAVSGSTRLIDGASGIGAVQQDMYANGPVQAAMLVYQDFFAYKSGIYQHNKSAKFLGKHSVKLVGYGVDPTAGAYWIAANSWGPKWGDEGYFRIVRGRGESGIESEIVYGQASLREIIV